MLEDISCGRGKDVHQFHGQMIGLHQAKKTTKENAETTKMGLRTVQRIIKTKSMNQDVQYLVPELWGHQGKKRGG